MATIKSYTDISQSKKLADKQKPAMIQWKGNNLKEVIDFTGIYKDGFEKWFHNSWEEYEKYVHEHNNIFKIFNKDGSHIEVPVGAWIVKTPDGYNTASRYVFRQKPVWSEEDEEMLKMVIKACEQCGNEYAYYWLKSLKERYTWKPSEEQIGALQRITQETVYGKDIFIVQKFVEQLKELL